MKKKLMILVSSMALLIILVVIIINLTSPKAVTKVISEKEPLKVVTTFYPIYMIGLNIADHVDDIEVKSLTDLNTGCLHDYQLTTEDMKSISNADILVINGGGMEAFLEDIKVNYPDLTIVDASQGITMLNNKAGTSSESLVADNLSSIEEHDTGEFNPHVWLNPTLYIKQIENVRDGLINYISSTYSDNEEFTSNLKKNINENSEVYINSVKVLEIQYDNSLQELLQVNGLTENQLSAVIFHDSFAYLADRAGIQVAFTVPLDSDTALSAGDIAIIIDAVKKDQIKYLFTEEQFSDSIAEQIAAETDAKVYIIDSVVTGDGAIDSYVKAMQKNLEVIESALQ